MIKMNLVKNIFSVLLLSVVFFGCQEPELGPTVACDFLESDVHPKGERYQEILNTYVKRGYPGVSLLVRDSSGTWYGSAGMADIKQGINALPCHTFKTGSITKNMVGALTFALIDEGKFSLDDLASEYIDQGIVDRIENLDKVTIRQLMNHTTGIYDVITDSDFYLEVINNPNKEWQASDLLRHIYKKEAYFKPGEYSQYSNSNTLLLSLVIEGATGASHRRLLDDKIIKKLGLSGTYYFPYHKLPNATAQGYFDLYNDGTITNVSNLITGDGNGYNGVYSTVFDLQTFIEALFREKTLLSDASLSAMQVFEPPKSVVDGSDPDAGHLYGLGIFKEFTKRQNADEWAVGHTGGDLGNAAEMYYFPNQDATFCLLINYGTNGSSSLGDFYQDFRNELVDLLME